MTEKTKTPKAAGLQRKTRRGKIDKAHALSGLGRAEFESAWNSLPEGVRRKCTAAELAQLVQILAEKPVNKSVKRELNGETVWNRAKIALVNAPGALRRELSRRPALLPVRDYVAGLQSALTALAVRLPWGKK